MRLYLIGFFAMLLISATSPALAVEYLSFLKLNISPEDYSGRELRLKGYARIDPDDLEQSESPYEFCGVIMHDESTMRAIRVYEMVRFCVTTKVPPVHLHYRYIGIRGTFHVGEDCPPILKFYMRRQPLGCLVNVGYVFHAEVEGLDEPMPPPEEAY